ncbi:MAG: hypothetical protein AAF569_09285 [Pseudomonadota bacterium]
MDNLHLEKQLTTLFEDIDPQKNIGISINAAVEKCLAEIETWLWKHTVDEYVDNLMINLEGCAFKNLGFDSHFPESCEGLEEGLYKIFETSEYAKRIPERHDLSDKTSLTLSDGKIIPINAHLKEKQND